MQIRKPPTGGSVRSPEGGAPSAAGPPRAAVSAVTAARAIPGAAASGGNLIGIGGSPAPWASGVSRRRCGHGRTPSIVGAVGVQRGGCERVGLTAARALRSGGGRRSGSVLVCRAVSHAGGVGPGARRLKPRATVAKPRLRAARRPRGRGPEGGSEAGDPWLPSHGSDVGHLAAEPRAGAASRPLPAASAAGRRGRAVSHPGREVSYVGHHWAAG